MKHETRKVAAYIFTAIMLLSAFLQAYWALGGTWFLGFA
jgi:hypothetical protein